MKHLTLTQLKKWKPCNGIDWVARMEKDFSKKAEWSDVLNVLIKEEKYSEINWLVGKRLEQLKKRQVCAFAYRCAKRSLRYAEKEHLPVLEKAIGFAREYAVKGKVDREAAWSAACSAARSAPWSADSAAWSAWSAAWSADWFAESAAWSAAQSAESAARSAWSAEYQWQFDQLAEIERGVPKNL